MRNALPVTVQTSSRPAALKGETIIHYRADSNTYSKVAVAKCLGAKIACKSLRTGAPTSARRFGGKLQYAINPPKYRNSSFAAASTITRDERRKPL